MNVGMMESIDMGTRSEVAENHEGAGEVLLDLGEFASGQSSADDDFVLDIDLEETPEPSPVEPAFPSAAFRGRDKYKSVVQAEPSAVGTNWSLLTAVSETPVPTTDQLAITEKFQRVTDEPVNESESAVGLQAAQAAKASAEQHETSTVAAEQYQPTTEKSSTEFSLQQLSPAMIDAIARRAVEQLSEKVVQEIAWEVVPQLAELLIKRQLEEKSSKLKPKQKQAPPGGRLLFDCLVAVVSSVAAIPGADMKTRSYYSTMPA